MNGHALVESLQAAAGDIAIGKALAHGVEDAVIGADRPADDQRAGVFQNAPDLLAAGDLADAGVAGIVAEHHHIADKEWSMRAGQIEQHAVVPGDRHDQHLGNFG